MTWEKVKMILELIKAYGLPLMEAGAKQTQNPFDDLVVALLKGGIPEVISKLDELEGNEGGS